MKRESRKKMKNSVADMRSKTVKKVVLLLSAVTLLDFAMLWWLFSPVFAKGRAKTAIRGGVLPSSYFFDSVSGRYLFALIFIAISYLMLIYFAHLLFSRQHEREREAVRQLADSTVEMTAEEFLSILPSVASGGRSEKSTEYTGVYILHNVTKDMYYVGQSVHVLQRLRQHLTGHGNGDVYADFKYGDQFTVRSVSLISSGYQSLNNLERDMIDAYDAMNSGYNRTRGNRA